MLKFKNTLDVSYQLSLYNNLQGGPKARIIAISVYSAMPLCGLINQNYCGCFELNLFHNI